MKILFLSFYFEPDLCAGSFRNSSLFKELLKNLDSNDQVDVITTLPNRYDSYNVKAAQKENPFPNVSIHRVAIPKHGSGILGQIKSFKKFYFEALEIANQEKYDLVYASSSRLFTAFLGSKLARNQNSKLYLDIRDIFRETIVDVFNNKILKYTLNLILIPIENYTFKKADHINLVSEGFMSYFKKYNTKFTYFTNGIDAVFLKEHNSSASKNAKRTILYAGNIGESQGLHIILPKAAKALEENFKFIVVGDGGAKDKLIKEIEILNVKNIQLLDPVNRNKLIEYYQKSDYLFLHLNKQKAFERVLPSKIFEYGAFNKPIIAGVSGFSRVFLENNVKNTITFNPGNIEELVTNLSDYTYVNYERECFKKKFSRLEINKEMAKSIYKLI
tara:strand:- start:298 stop:1461 length:1164 start_codon:yes stop_codon:yes gene_type:complete